MEENQLQTKLKLSPQFSLDISSKGDLKVTGEVLPTELQTILDSSHLRASLYQKHQEYLQREADRTALYIGFIFSGLIGLSIFCLFNQSPKNAFIHSLEIVKTV